MLSRRYLPLLGLAPFAGLLGAGAAASAAVINLSTSAYSTLYSGPDANNLNGGGPVFFCGGGPTATGPSGWHDRALLDFDVADAIPAGATITGVDLTLYMSFAAGSSGTGSPVNTDGLSHIMDLHALTSPWGQDTGSESSYDVAGTSGTGGGTGGGTPTATVGQHGATWNQSFYGQTNWNTAGGGGDFTSTVSASQSVGDTGGGVAYTWGSTAQMISDVQGWVDGTTPNDGWALVSEDETLNKSFRNFFSLPGALAQGEPGLAPDLQITYTVAAVPEPASLGLLAVGTPLLLRRRRRVRLTQP